MNKGFCDVCRKKRDLANADLVYRGSRQNKNLCRDCVLTVRWLRGGGIDCSCEIPQEREQ